MGAEDVKKLEMRIAKLESLVEASAAMREPVDISADEIRAYRKIRDIVAADYGDFCGINDCFRCIVRCLRCWSCDLCLRRCDVECSCGPCNIGQMGGLRGRLSRFSDLGD